MGYIGLLIIAVSLCFDTFSVSISGGLSLKTKLSAVQVLKIICTFGVFQAGFTMIGWGLGNSFSDYLTQYDHWVAFGLLSLLGAKMIYDSLIPDTQESIALDLLDYKKIIILAVATSIDAMAVGVSLSFLHLGAFKAIFTSISVFVFTALASYIGIHLAKIFSSKLGQHSGLVGGIILILIGTKILLEHLAII